MRDTKAEAELQDVIMSLDRALSACEINEVLNLFADDCYWRDFLSFTWNIKTVEGKAQIRDMLENCLERVQPSQWETDDNEVVSHVDGVTECFIRFETPVAPGYGHIRLKKGKIWTLFTAMVDLKGYEEPAGSTRPRGARHGIHQDDPTWLEERKKEQAELGVSTQPYVLIIGGGQGGIGLAARLRQHGVPALIVERNARPGDSWRKRYKSLSLHDPVWYDHMPYIKFPDNWPVFSPKDKIADWLEMYAKVMELNFWGNTEAKSASYDDNTKTWTVVVEREGRQVTIRPKQLVLATGMSGKPNVPTFPGQDVFKGVQQHSSEHEGPTPDMFGKKVAVIGSNNSAHDICAALAGAGVEATMIQRSATHVSRSAPLMKHSMGPLYSHEAVEKGISTENADLLFASMPYAILPNVLKDATDAIREEDAEFYRHLEQAGFMHTFGPDESGLTMMYLRRASGYYIGVGASQLILDGKIKLESGSEVECLTENSVVLADGREISADIVIYATGYGSMNEWAAALISREIADKVGKVWGIGSDTPKDPGPWEGEQRNMWKPTQQEGLWFHGGNLAQSRQYSHYLALQLKARLEGIPTPVYRLQEVYHRS